MHPHLKNNSWLCVHRRRESGWGSDTRVISCRLCLRAELFTGGSESLPSCLGCRLSLPYEDEDEDEAASSGPGA